jgi:hypothetical protein
VLALGTARRRREHARRTDAEFPLSQSGGCIGAITASASQVARLRRVQGQVRDGRVETRRGRAAGRQLMGQRHGEPASRLMTRGRVVDAACIGEQYILSPLAAVLILAGLSSLAQTHRTFTVSPSDRDASRVFFSPQCKRVGVSSA